MTFSDVISPTGNGNLSIAIISENTAFIPAEQS